MPLTDSDRPLLELLAAGRHGVIVALKKDGRPQLSNISYAYDPDQHLAKISITATRAKFHNLRRDPRASLYVAGADFWSFVVAEGTAELSAIAADPHDAAADELVEVYRAIGGEHPDWEDYRRAMVADQRVVLRLRIDRVYGLPPAQ